MANKGNAASHGIKDVTFAKLDDAGKLITGEKGLTETGIYVAKGNGIGFTAANITGLEVEGTPQYGNDEILRISHGQAQPKVALTALDIDHAILMNMLGYLNDGKGGYVKGLVKPYIAMLIHSRSLDNTVQIYEGLACTEIISDSSNHATDTNNESDANPTLSADVLSPRDPTVFQDPSDPTVQQPYKKWFSDEPNYDLAAIYKETLGGYIAIGGGAPSPSAPSPSSSES